MDAVGQRHVSFAQASNFLEKCQSRPERMRLLCSTSARREGGDCLAVTVEVAAGGPSVEVQELSMADGWTGCRFSPSALWLAVRLAEDSAFGVMMRANLLGGGRPKALELGCGVALAGLTAHVLGFDTTLTDCLPGHLRNLQALRQRLRAQQPSCAQLDVCCLDWQEEESRLPGTCYVDRGSPENGGTE